MLPPAPKPQGIAGLAGSRIGMMASYPERLAASGNPGVPGLLGGLASSRMNQMQAYRDRMAKNATLSPLMQMFMRNHTTMPTTPEPQTGGLTSRLMQLNGGFLR